MENSWLTVEVQTVKNVITVSTAFGMPEKHVLTVAANAALAHNVATVFKMEMLRVVQMGDAQINSIFSGFFIQYKLSAVIKTD